MTTLIVLFNLKDPGSKGAYERWAREVDSTEVGRLPSVSKFELLKASGLLGGGKAPYEYIEVIRLNDMTRFIADVGTAAMQKVAAQFQGFADNPLFIVTESL